MISPITPRGPPSAWDSRSTGCAGRWGALYAKLHGGLTDADLEPWAKDADGGRFHLLRFLADRPGISAWLRFKAALVEEMIAGFREVMNESGGEEMELLPNAFPPPWTIVSGMDFGRVAQHSSAISCKLYTMHWPMMLRFYGDQILNANPGLSSRLLARALVRWLDIADDDGLDTVEDYSYPPPDQAHPVGPLAQRRKIRQAQRQAGDTPVYVLAHGYGPLEDFRSRLEVAKRAGDHGYWVNRYGLSERREAGGNPRRRRLTRRRATGLRPAVAAPRRAETSGNRRSGTSDLAMLYCPNCSQRLEALGCKLRCTRCGYFMDCSDYC